VDGDSESGHGDWYADEGGEGNWGLNILTMFRVLMLVGGGGGGGPCFVGVVKWEPWTSRTRSGKGNICGVGGRRDQHWHRW